MTPAQETPVRPASALAQPQRPRAQLERSAVPASGVVHALSFDIEDWFHMVGIPAVEDPTTWDDLPSLAVEMTEWILETLAAHRVRATFFVLGWVAAKYPQIARMVAHEGHELASHS